VKTRLTIKRLSGCVLKSVLLKNNCNLKWIASNIACVCKTRWNPKNKTTLDFCKCKFKDNFVNELASS
jgi:hypothetical protein